MLPAESRMRRGAEFTTVVRKGCRGGQQLVSGHLLVQGDAAPRIGFIVSRKVGTAVVRNRVKRRLRHLARGYLGALPAGSLVVVRASPQAATARQADLAADLDLVIKKLLRRQGGHSSQSHDQQRRRYRADGTS